MTLEESIELDDEYTNAKIRGLNKTAYFESHGNNDTEICKEQLIKAKDLLLRFIELKNKPCAVGHSVNMLLYENICADVKQFLKDSEVEK